MKHKNRERYRQCFDPNSEETTSRLFHAQTVTTQNICYCWLEIYEIEMITIFISIYVPSLSTEQDFHLLLFV